VNATIAAMPTVHRWLRCILLTTQLLNLMAPPLLSVPVDGTLLWPWQDRSRATSGLFPDRHRHVATLAFAVPTFSYTEILRYAKKRASDCFSSFFPLEPVIQ